MQQNNSNYNYPQQPQNPNFPQQQPNVSSPQQTTDNFQQPQIMQQQPINTAFSHPPPDMRQRPFQSLPVIYDNTVFIVDPTALCNSSQKFKELITPFIQDYTQMKELHLEIIGNQFTKRNINNFLRICQKLPTDVQNSEVEQICEIAKMFKAEEIYNKGLQFIQSNIDPNFCVPENKYDGSDGKTYLVIEAETNLIHHDSDISDATFEDSENSNTDSKQFYKPNPKDEQQSKPEQKNQKEIVGDEFHERKHAVVYQIKFENHAFKCPVFKFVADDHIIYSAKQKYNELYIANGADIHIRNKENHVARIFQNETTKSNVVNTKDHKFEIKYVNSGGTTHFSLDVTFPFEDRTLHWTPKPPRYDPVRDKFFLNFHGEYHHTPVLSSKNTVLQNDNGHATMIIRKMSPTVYEVECLPVVDKLTVFAIGLSEIVGPYFDPWMGEYYE